MKLKIRYENEYQTITLDAETTEELWVFLSLEGEGLSQEEREKLIQEKWEKQFNRPDYNCWHKFWRHHGEAKAKPGDEENEVDTSEPLMDEVADDRIFRKDELGREERESYEAVCQLVREACGKEADWTEMFIAIRIDGVSINDYADQIGADSSNISHKLDRAAKKIEKFMQNLHGRNPSWEMRRALGVWRRWDKRNQHGQAGGIQSDDTGLPGRED